MLIDNSRTLISNLPYSEELKPRSCETLSLARTDPSNLGICFKASMMLSFFDTKEESIIDALKHMPKFDGSVRAKDNVSQLLGFSSSLYGRLDIKVLELSISMLGKELSTRLKREVPKENHSSNPECVQAIKRQSTRCCYHALVLRRRVPIISPRRLPSL